MSNTKKHGFAVDIREVKNIKMIAFDGAGGEVKKGCIKTPLIKGFLYTPFYTSATP